jgi:Fic family protein
MKTIDYSFIGLVEEQLKRVFAKKEQLDAHRPLPQVVVNRLQENLALEWTYNSNAIEGNTLSLNETISVLETGITIGGKSLNEHFEVINHDKAIHYLQGLVAKQEPIRSIDLLKIHELVMANIDLHFAGRIRNGIVRIAGANFTPPSPAKVPDLLDELIEFVVTNPEGLSAPVMATIFHHQFVHIHPFFDGNGRTGRLAMNMLLMQAGFPPAIILKLDRSKYYSALNLANKGSYEKLCIMVLQGLERSLNLYLEAIPGQYKVYEPIANIVSEPDAPYGMEYVSLLARKGLIDAQKEGKNWVTTREAVAEYASKMKKSK